jgi:hypothetical protein
MNKEQVKKNPREASMTTKQKDDTPPRAWNSPKASSRSTSGV